MILGGRGNLAKPCWPPSYQCRSCYCWWLNSWQGNHLYPICTFCLLDVKMKASQKSYTKCLCPVTKKTHKTRIKYKQVNAWHMADAATIKSNTHHWEITPLALGEIKVWYWQNPSNRFFFGGGHSRDSLWQKRFDRIIFLNTLVNKHEDSPGVDVCWPFRVRCKEICVVAGQKSKAPVGTPITKSMM